MTQRFVAKCHNHGSCMRIKTVPVIIGPTRTSKTIILLISSLIGINIIATHLLVRADDSAAAPALDIGALASLASNLGSNPQIMNLVSSFLNPNGGQQKPSVGSANTIGSGGGIQSDLGNASDLESNSIDLTSRQSGTGEPLRRGTRPVMEQQQQQTQAKSIPDPMPDTVTQPEMINTIQKPTSSSAISQSGATSAASSSNPLSGLMSMLPNVLSGMSGGSGGGMNLGSLTSLLGLNKPASTSTVSSSSRSSDLESGLGSKSNVPAQSTGTSVQTTSAGPISAQQVINQVLTAYASGQIPNELIQLSLSGRVPPQIIELALSGQVPMEMIKMVITGQVPMSTINTFLGAIQPPQAALTTQQAGPRVSNQKVSNPGVFSTTRSLFEALFGLGRFKDPNHPESNKSGINLPTLMGPIPLKVPSLPNMRSIGQLVGGTITNFSSMIPF